MHVFTGSVCFFFVVSHVYPFSTILHKNYVKTDDPLRSISKLIYLFKGLLWNPGRGLEKWHEWVCFSKGNRHKENMQTPHRRSRPTHWAVVETNVSGELLVLQKVPSLWKTSWHYETGNSLSSSWPLCTCDLYHQASQVYFKLQE